MQFYMNNFFKSFLDSVFTNDIGPVLSHSHGSTVLIIDTVTTITSVATVTNTSTSIMEQCHDEIPVK